MVRSDGLKAIPANFVQFSQDFSSCAKITAHAILLQNCHVSINLTKDDLPMFIQTLLLLLIGNGEV